MSTSADKPAPSVMIFPQQLDTQLRQDLHDADPDNNVQAPKSDKTLAVGLAKTPGAIPAIRHYVEIKSFKVNSTSIGENLGETIEKIGNAIGATAGIDGFENDATIGDLLGTFLGQEKASTQLDGTIYLYVPNNLKQPDVTVDYLDPDMINSTAALAIGKGLLDGVKNSDGITEILGNISDELGHQGFSSDAIMHFIPRLVSKLGINADIVKNTLARKAGKVINPMQTQIFKGIQLRTFTLSWGLAPKNAPEAKAIAEIIHFLKKAVRPSTTTSRFLLNFPNEFEVTFKTGDRKNKITDNKHLFKSKRCVVTGMSIDPTSGGKFAAFGTNTPFDGMPVMQELTLQFKELDIVTRNDIDGDSEQVGGKKHIKGTGAGTSEKANNATKTPRAY
jgi:hypothetical protein